MASCNSLSGITIGHVALLLGLMMRQTMSLKGFWENDADVSMFWVRPVERSPLIRATLEVHAWAAKRKWNPLCILHTFFAHAAWHRRKKPTWPDVWKLKCTVIPGAYCSSLCNCYGFLIWRTQLLVSNANACHFRQVCPLTQTPPYLCARSPLHIDNYAIWKSFLLCALCIISCFEWDLSQ